MNAMSGVEAGGSFFRAPLGSPGLASASISQKTEINVHGSGDAHTAARIVTASQDRVNGNLVRNLRAVVA
jgi:hypothetical protein